ncbi:MAG TPA: bifunctional precorrin-2 dehydrogenase/sirohydrochlorin ferrochelatase [Acidimicrobiales bacterium]|nr:bifunctional precorrin-2 dehydrogenase/sirohydrochlorin ferrochelatase [Acidimicrobiales bacterium]
MGIDADLYPVGLIVAGQRCLVVGGGRVAARKIASLLGCGAAVTVVAPEAHVAVGLLAADGAFDRLVGPHPEVHLRPYRPGEAAGYRLVVTATGDPSVDGLVFRDATEAGVWVNSADDPDHCSFVLPAVSRDGAVTIAVSTGGSSPALASWLRRRIAEAVGPGLGSLAALLDDTRRRIHALGASTETVDWQTLLDGPLPDLVRQGKVAEAQRLLDGAVDSARPASSDEG